MGTTSMSTQCKRRCIPPTWLALCKPALSARMAPKSGGVGSPKATVRLASSRRARTATALSQTPSGRAMLCLCSYTPTSGHAAL